jgi:hypothetical protein
MFTGAVYNPPLGTTNRILSFSNGVVVCQGGELSQPVTTNVVVAPNNKVTSPGSTKPVLTLTPATGLFNGSVVDPTTGKPLLLKGALLQGLDFGSGYFLGTNQSGQVRFEAAP